MKRLLPALMTVLLIATGGNARAQDEVATSPGSGPTPAGPFELQMQFGGGTNIDLRLLPKTKPVPREPIEKGEPPLNPIELPGGPTAGIPEVPPEPRPPAPGADKLYEGLNREFNGSGSPPDPNGDVGPVYYIQTVNTSVGIFRKSDGFQEAAFTFDALMSQGSFGNQCDTENFGDPVVLYDTFEDRWVVTDFAFTLDAGGNVNPPEAFQCFAVSKNGDPLTGGWWFYSIKVTDFLNDYPKLGVWPDGIYMTANMFGFAAGGSFQHVRVWAFNKTQMYAGAPTVQVVSFNQGGDFTIVPSNARLQTGRPPAGRPNLFISTWNFLNALTVYKFHVDWTNLSLSTFTGPDTPLNATSWPNAAVPNAPQPGTANLLDVLQIRAMVQNQYTNLGGAESLWIPHTVRRANTTGFAAPRWYQVNVTGGTVASPTVQGTTWDPDAANTNHRFMPSLAVDRAGNMALGYSISNATTVFPSMRYAGRLAADPVNTFSQTETELFAGTASQTTSSRWGDYSSMTLDPDGCRFWYTNEYANPDDQTAAKRWKTKIASVPGFPGCTPVGAGGTVSGTVTATTGGAPIAGATVNLGSRTDTTDGSGFYEFTNIPAGTYPSLTASAPGFDSQTFTSIVVTDGATTTQDFSLANHPASACVTDTTQADFQAGEPTNVDVNTTPGDVLLAKPDVIDQQNTTVTNAGFGFNSTAWAGQTFLAAATGQVTRVDVNLFCAGCTGTTPNITVAIRATTGSPAVPTGPDLATATIPGFNSGAGGYFSAIFATPTTITSGTTYAVIFRADANPSAGTYAYVCSCASPNSNPYANGQRVTSANSGGTWAADVTSGGRDLGFKIFVNAGYSPSGNLVSSNKDSNQAPGLSPHWTQMSWTGTAPTNTELKFQAAASNSQYGPFNFVGPDGTGATFYTTSPGSLGQFEGLRYLKYKAYLATTDGTVTSSVQDVTVCYEPAVDLSITKSDGGASVAPGGTVSYTLTYGNSSPTGATGVVLTEVVPANTTFNAGASTAGWSCAPDNNPGSTCTLSIGAVAGGSSGLTATFALTVVNPVGAGVTQISNTASIADDGSHGTDTTPGNNSGSDTTPVTGAPDLSITKSDGGASVAAGGTVSYTLTYANGGNQGASGVVLTETVPANTTFNAGASTAGWSCTPDNNAGSTCTLAVGTLVGASGNQTATFAATVDNPLPAGVSQISNTASIADDGTNGPDPTPGDNSGSDTTPIVSPDLTISKSDAGISAVPGQTIAYTLTYANVGAVGATGVEISETVPADTTFNSGASTAGWNCTPDNNAGSTCTLTVGTLAAGSGDQTATFAVTVDNPLSAAVTQISNTASIADDGTNGTDPTPGNNSDSETTTVVSGNYYTVTQCRLVDTRNVAGPYGGPALAAQSTRTFVAGGQCGVPADAKALVFIVGATNATSTGHLRLFSSDLSLPLISMINYAAGQTRSNNGIVGLGAGGDFDVFVGQPTGTVDVVIDVHGYFK